jgi:phosphoribosyl 1,2-cyclic phosphodiesterase
MADKEFFVRFWGVRGSVPVSGPSTCKYGGNTPCVEVRCGDRTLMLDAGSGAFLFGESLKNNKTGEIDILFSHCHYDHIEGAPFFAPVHLCDWQVRYWSGHQSGKMTTRDMIKTYMRQPYFPVGPEVFCAEATFHDFEPEDVLDLRDGILVKTLFLNHPDGAVGYRIEFDGRSICYITDMEHQEGKTDKKLQDFIAGSGMVIYDAMYDDSEYQAHKGWGHSTWQEGVRLCDKADVDLYVAFHHQPCHDDATLDKISLQLEKQRPRSVLAKEGAVLRPAK